MHRGGQRPEERVCGKLCVELQPSRMKSAYRLLDEVSREHQLLQEPVRVVLASAGLRLRSASLLQAAGRGCVPEPPPPARALAPRVISATQ